MLIVSACSTSPGMSLVDSRHNASHHPVTPGRTTTFRWQLSRSHLSFNVKALPRMPSRKMLSSPFSSSSSRSGLEHTASMPASTGTSGVSEVLSNNLTHSVTRNSGDFGYFSVLEAPESLIDSDAEEKFRASFAFDEKEKLLGCSY